MTIGLWGWVVFALVFFAVDSAREVCVSEPPRRVIFALVAVTFFVLAYAVARFG